MAKPGKGIISTSRVEVLNITTMNLLMRNPDNPSRALLSAARRHAASLHGLISELSALIDPKKMDDGELSDLVAYLITLDALLDSLKEQAATIGSPELEFTYKDAGNALRSFVQGLKSVDLDFAGIYTGMVGTVE